MSAYVWVRMHACTCYCIQFAISLFALCSRQPLKISILLCLYLIWHSPQGAILPPPPPPPPDPDKDENLEEDDRLYDPDEAAVEDEEDDEEEDGELTFRPFSGVGYQLKGQTTGNELKTKEENEKETNNSSNSTGFVPFSGKGYTLSNAGNCDCESLVVTCLYSS